MSPAPSFKLAVVRRRLAFAGAKKRRVKRLPKQKPPDLIAAAYYQRLREILQRARELIYKQVIPRLPALVRSAALARGDARMDAPSDFNRELDAQAAKFFEALDNTGELEQLSEMIARRTERYQGSQLQAQVRAAVGVEIPFQDRGMRARIEGFTSENVALIKSIPSRYFDDVEKVVTRGVADGKRWEEIADELGERYDVAESSAKLIARDQTGKFFGDLNEARQTELGIDKYVWRTSNDNRVRPEHEEREGQVFSWDSPPEDGNPGEPVLCRCFAEPLLDALLEDL